MKIKFATTEHVQGVTYPREALAHCLKYHIPQERMPKIAKLLEGHTPYHQKYILKMAYKLADYWDDHQPAPGYKHQAESKKYGKSFEHKLTDILEQIIEMTDMNAELIDDSK